MTEPTPLEECSRIVSLVYDDELAPDTALVVLGKQLDRVRAEAKREERERYEGHECYKRIADLEAENARLRDAAEVLDD